MPEILISNISDIIFNQIQRRANANKRSVDEEALEMLCRQLVHANVTESSTLSKENILDIASRIFGPNGGVELDLPLRGSLPGREPPDFSGPEFDR